ncbi:D-alanine--D-alanine ligase [Shewanella denitrificans OS217]|uniref:D-alanine--D-alanine ligase n=1 Tax=Shewanella denitrificans (strain OS217 / ATCC BAA-1090 / DSM 15013) TaxID=318161 RepID=DDL_SHEDO|nr:D-alanine--D-alanine ligase [Shewanella denitrificans]Q12LP2.1 RecName: Full=D-alanine--D-alanine ligase; AltName: Full=D-Ala-D-Ala ligase; AltName: Full=D-alanylalanine synthetase [Shewanella denitrificans OS217]ABE55634.1 D-alanine--D-alanine ligase [Shewanella denitrificans OS217]
MAKINVLLLCGGGGAEHDISLMSARFFETSLAKSDQFSVLTLTLDKQGRYHTQDGNLCSLTNRREIRFEDPSIAPWAVDYVIPCIHGFPGETGDIQSYFNLIQLPYFGCESEASSNCFNKITAKMWFSALGVPNTPYIFLHQFDQEAIAQTQAAFDTWGSVFIKAASQGSSVGCYKVDVRDNIAKVLEEAFGYAPYVVVEKTIKARELEVAVYEYQGDIIATLPGEIICDTNKFYSFDEKYAKDSKARTDVVASNLSPKLCLQIQDYAIKAFKGMKLRHLSRIDFFLTQDDEILLNEINTFPGLTPISMFPKMLQNHGHDFTEYLSDVISQQLGR